ncbi:MAG: tetratricopeptide repeat protein [Acidobacteriota bacterium]
MSIPTLTVRKRLEAASALRSAGSFSEALEMLDSPGEFRADLCAMRGGIEFALGRFEDAALSYSAVALSQPDSPEAHYNLALCLQRSRRWDAAADAFERVLRLDADCTEARLALGACLLEMNRAEDALENFDRVRASQRKPALFGKAVTLQILGRFDEAAEIYEGLLASDPNLEEVLSNLIAMSVETHDVSGMRQHSLRLLHICPHSVAALQGLVTAAFQDGDHEDAVSYCSRLLDLTPDSLEAWHNFRIAIGHFQFGGNKPAFAMHSGGK